MELKTKYNEKYNVEGQDCKSVHNSVWVLWEKKKKLNKNFFYYLYFSELQTQCKMLLQKHPFFCLKTYFKFQWDHSKEVWLHLWCITFQNVWRKFQIYGNSFYSHIYSISELSIAKITWQIEAVVQGILVYRRPLFLICWEDVYLILERILWLIQKYSLEVKKKEEK